MARKRYLLGAVLLVAACGKTGFESLDSVALRSVPDGGGPSPASGGSPGVSETPIGSTGDSTGEAGESSGQGDPTMGDAGALGNGEGGITGAAGNTAEQPSGGAISGGGGPGSQNGGASSTAGAAGAAEPATGGTLGAGGSALAGAGGTTIGGGSGVGGTSSAGAGGISTGGSPSAGSGGTGGAGAGGTSSGGMAGSANGGAASGGTGGGGAGSGGAATGGSGGAPSIAGCETRSYESSNYLVCTSEATWIAAEAACASVGMFLVRVDSAAENQWLFDTAYEVNPLSDALWIGGSDAAVEGEWRWTDGTLFWLGTSTGAAQGGLFTNWYANHPSGNQANDCVVIDLGPETSPGWYANRCDAGTNAYACESP